MDPYVDGFSQTGKLQRQRQPKKEVSKELFYVQTSDGYKDQLKQHFEDANKSIRLMESEFIKSGTISTKDTISKNFDSGSRKSLSRFTTSRAKGFKSPDHYGISNTSSKI